MSQLSLAPLKSSPSTILYTKIKKKLSNQRAVLDAFLNDIDVPSWYRGLSVFQLAAANKLYYALRDDGEQKTAYRTRNCLLRIGISPCIEMKPIRFLMRLSRLNDIAFLWFLMELHYKMPSVSYSLNEQLIMSVIAHLDMITTLRELNRILPPPQPPKNAVPRKRPKPEPISAVESIRHSIRQSIRESINRTNVKVKKKQNCLPYFEELKPPKAYGEKLTSRSPEFRVNFNTYNAYRDPTYVVHNESNRWYSDYKLSASNRIAHRVIYDEVERLLKNFEALTMRADVVQTLCSHHQVIHELERSLEMQLQVVARERCLNHFNLLKDPTAVIRERVTSQLEKDVRMYMQEFKRQAERSRKSSVIQILSQQDIHETAMADNCGDFPPADGDWMEQRSEQAKKRVSYKDQLASKQKVECGVNTDIEFTRFVKYEVNFCSQECGDASVPSPQCATLRTADGHHCFQHLHDDDADANAWPQSPPSLQQGRHRRSEYDERYPAARRAPRQKWHSEFFEYYRNDDYSPCQHGDCICSVRVGRLCGGQERGYSDIWFPKGVRAKGTLPLRPAPKPFTYTKSYASMRTLQVRENAEARQRDKKQKKKYELANLQSVNFSLRPIRSSARTGHMQPVDSELFFEAAEPHTPYKFNYRNIFRFKENTPDNLAIRRQFIEAIDSELKNLSRLHDSQLDLGRVASADAKRLWFDEVEQRNYKMEEERRRIALAHPNPLGYNDKYYDPDNKQLMRQMLKDALAYMSQNPKFVLASMPDAYKIPMLLEWTAFRYGKVYSRRERFNEFRLSLNVMKTLNDHLLDIRLPRSGDIKCMQNFVISYERRDSIIQKVKKMRRRYNHSLNHSLMRHTRVFWFAMRPYLCGAQTGNTFFAYMPSRVSEILRFRAWKPHEHRLDFEGWNARIVAKHKKNCDLLDYNLERNNDTNETAISYMMDY